MGGDSHWFLQWQVAISLVTGFPTEMCRAALFGVTSSLWIINHRSKSHLVLTSEQILSVYFLFSLQSEWRMNYALCEVWLILEIIRWKFQIHSNWSKLLIHTHGLTSLFLWEKAMFSFAFNIFVLNIIGSLPSLPPCFNLTSLPYVSHSLNIPIKQKTTYAVANLLLHTYFFFLATVMQNV